VTPTSRTPFGGARVAYLETRRASEMDSLISRHGGVPVPLPALSEIPNDPSPSANATIDRLARRQFDVVVFLTGVGVTHLLAAADAQGCLVEVEAALDKAIKVCRGPKPAAALRKRGITPGWLVPEPHTTPCLIETLAQLSVLEREVLIVCAGERWDEPGATLVERGAHVTHVEPYRWGLSEENARALAAGVTAIVDGHVDAVAFTSQTQVRYLFDIAEQQGAVSALRDRLEHDVLVGAVGPTCAEALASRGASAHVVPQHAKMGHLVIALAEAMYLHGGPSATALKNRSP
jgi:uroporphyrinogen-III synthase